MSSCKGFVFLFAPFRRIFPLSFCLIFLLTLFLPLTRPSFTSAQYTPENVSSPENWKWGVEPKQKYRTQVCRYIALWHLNGYPSHNIFGHKYGLALQAEIKKILEAKMALPKPEREKYLIDLWSDMAALEIETNVARLEHHLRNLIIECVSASFSAGAGEVDAAIGAAVSGEAAAFIPDAWPGNSYQEMRLFLLSLYFQSVCGCSVPELDQGHSAASMSSVGWLEGRVEQGEFRSRLGVILSASIKTSSLNLHRINLQHLFTKEMTYIEKAPPEKLFPLIAALAHDLEYLQLEWLNDASITTTGVKLTAVSILAGVIALTVPPITLSTAAAGMMGGGFLGGTIGWAGYEKEQEIRAELLHIRQVVYAKLLGLSKEACRCKEQDETDTTEANAEDADAEDTDAEDVHVADIHVKGKGTAVLIKKWGAKAHMEWNIPNPTGVKVKFDRGEMHQWILHNDSQGRFKDGEWVTIETIGLTLPPEGLVKNQVKRWFPCSKERDCSGKFSAVYTGTLNEKPVRLTLEFDGADIKFNY